MSQCFLCSVPEQPKPSQAAAAPPSAAPAPKPLADKADKKEDVDRVIQEMKAFNDRLNKYERVPLKSGTSVIVTMAASPCEVYVCSGAIKKFQIFLCLSVESFECEGVVFN